MTAITSTYKAESGHWYAQSGEPAYTIIGANGLERNTTLRDARKLGLVPSVTTVMGVAAKPALENWKIDRALESAIKLTRYASETDAKFMARAKWDSKKSGKEAAVKGTRIHAMLEMGFTLGVDSEVFRTVRELLEGIYPNETWFAEDSFCTDGYGGKIDLYSKSGIFVDFKTKDDLDVDNVSRMVYDEHGMQLSAYANGMNFNNPERCSIFVDRDIPSRVGYYIWETETHQKHLKMFQNLLSYWQLTKNYDSGETI
tara:strand:- start:341 stop:1111 length:771 start_codon:yes stop_codon:yes gene_type:complete